MLPVAAEAQYGSNDQLRPMPGACAVLSSDDHFQASCEIVPVLDRVPIDPVARGSFREVVPVHRLAYSFGWDGSEAVPPGSSLIEIDLIEQPDGTLLRLTHTGLPNSEQCANHADGWAHYLGRLAEVAAGRDPGPDPRHGRTGSE